MLCCVRFGADFGPKFSKIFRGRKIFHSKSREIAPKSAVPHVLQPGNDPQGSPNTVPSVGMLRRVRFGAIRGEFRTEIFEKICGRKNVASEIVRDGTKIRAARRRAALPRPAEVPKHCAERRNAAARDIACD